MPITLALADDSEFMRKAVKRFLGSDPEIELVGEASNFKQTIQLVKELKPQMVVFDVYMGHGNSVIPAEIKSSLADSRLLAISFSTNSETKALAYSFGAIECLDKSKLAEELIPAIKRWIKA